EALSGEKTPRQKMQPGKEPPRQKSHRKQAVKKRGKEISVERKSHTDSCFRQALHNYHTQFGRNELFFYKERQILLNLAKNPTGFNQNIDVLLQDRAPKDLIIVINDNDQDGVDVSWLWDVDFDRLADDSVRSIYVSGTRALDMQLRLKYVGIDAAVMETPEEAIRAFLREDGNADRKCTGNLYILVNYTALMPVHLFLQKICTGTEQNRQKKYRDFDRDTRLLPRVAKFIRRDG
ncbi:MAG: DUF1727 domain-containing protein, partial [Eubacteriales bacterium]|nr:DUF1727 domain-containing protein [Eubacteriales bacterium]